MADAATTSDAVRTGTGTRDHHSFLWRRLGTLSILFQLRFGAVG